MLHTPLPDLPTLEDQLQAWAICYRRYQHIARGTFPYPDNASAHAALQEIYTEWNIVCDWLAARGISDEMIVYDEATATCRLLSCSVERAEIEVHVAAYSHWYKCYDEIVSGALTFPDPRSRKRAEQEASEQWDAAYQWLWQHGISDWMLLYNSVDKTFSLPTHWTSYRDE